MQRSAVGSFPVWFSGKEHTLRELWRSDELVRLRIAFLDRRRDLSDEEWILLHAIVETVAGLGGYELFAVERGGRPTEDDTDELVMLVRCLRHQHRTARSTIKEAALAVLGPGRARGLSRLLKANRAAHWRRSLPPEVILQHLSAEQLAQLRDAGMRLAKMKRKNV